ncbi:MAG: tRNA nucleotidyltransferase [Oscillospiraceae bacterium]|nr:tRNA nucleotidyltransferase [Oscillospiraceae bacterium]
MNLPVFVSDILKTLEAAGYPAYLVGGPVRDLVMGKQPGDWDITSAATPETVQSLFPKTVPTGLKHGTVTVVSDGKHIEVTTFRRDGAYTDHRRPEQVDFVTDLCEDLARRDFTINAMALDLRGALTDPFGGQTDIAAELIRCVGEPETRFEEDALRMFRALRFSAQLGFTIDPATLAASKAKSHLAAHLSAERVRDEVEKILMSPRPEVLAEVITVGLLTNYLTSQAPERWAQRSLQGLDRLGRWAAFAAYGADIQAFRLDGNTTTIASTAAVLAADLPCDPVALKRLLAQYGVASVRCAAELSDSVDALERVFISGDPYALDALAISGADLIAAGHAPGPDLGVLLSQLLDHVIQFPADNQREILLKKAEELS